jgi:monofunctional biosynthetic peptidoglycan transglycosylase
MAGGASGRSRLRQIARALIAFVAILFATVAYCWLTLPDVRTLRTQTPTSTAFMRMRAREAESEGKKVTVAHRYVRYGRISPLLIRAVLAAEDAAFFTHDGVDYEGLRQSMLTNWERFQFLRGASTITQQLAKNLYLSPSRNPYRKLQELMITRRMEAELSKVRILELYLNLIEWGDGIWGAEAASLRYFGIPASDLSSEQAALLAGAIINPRRYSPARPNARLLSRQKIILGRIGQKTAPTETPAPAVPTPFPLPMSTAIPTPTPTPATGAGSTPGS